MTILPNHSPHYNMTNSDICDSREPKLRSNSKQATTTSGTRHAVHDAWSVCRLVVQSKVQLKFSAFTVQCCLCCLILYTCVDMWFESVLDPGPRLRIMACSLAVVAGNSHCTVCYMLTQIPLACY